MRSRRRKYLAAVSAVPLLAAQQAVAPQDADGDVRKKVKLI